jgi:hypothetical protein
LYYEVAVPKCNWNEITFAGMEVGHGVYGGLSGTACLLWNLHAEILCRMPSELFVNFVFGLSPLYNGIILFGPMKM